jgi:hypothetical protein
MRVVRRYDDYAQGLERLRFQHETPRERELGSEQQTPRECELV